MSLSQTDIDNMNFIERIAAASYKLGWDTPPEGLAWDSWADGWRDYLRWLLHPIIPMPQTQPRTVYCSGTPSTSTALVAAALSNASLTAPDTDPPASEHDLLGLCLAVWAGLNA